MSVVIVKNDAVSMCAKFWILPNQTVKNGLKRSNCSKWFFFLKKTTNEICACCPLSLCKILKKFLEPIQSYEDVLFSKPKWPISPEHFCFGTIYYYYFNLPISSFQCRILKKNSYSRSRVMQMCHFWAQNVFEKSY